MNKILGVIITQTNLVIGFAIIFKYCFYFHLHYIVKTEKYMLLIELY